MNRLRTYWSPIVVGLLLRIAYAIWLQDSWLQEDAGGYFQDALWILEGKEIPPFWPPGIPYFLAGLLFLFGSSPAVAMGGMMICYVAFCWLFAILSHSCLSNRHARILLFGFALYPAWIHHSVAPLSHLPVAICLLGSLILILRILRQQASGTHMTALSGYLLGLGIVWAIMVLIRPGTLVLIPVSIFVMGWLLRPSWNKIFLSTIPPLLLSFLLIGSWDLHLYQTHHRWVGINDATAMNIFIGNHPSTPLYKTWWLGSHDEQNNPAYDAFYTKRESIRSLPLDQQGPAYTQEAWIHIQQQPFTFVLRTVNRIRCFFAFDTYAGATTLAKSLPLAILFFLLDAALFIAIGILFILGIVSSKIHTSYRISILALIVAYGLPYYLTFSHPTYHFAIVPLMAIFAGRGLECVKTKIDWNGWHKVGIAIFGWIQLEWVIVMIWDRFPL